LDNAESVTPPEPKTAGGWLASNLMPLAFVAGVVALIVWRGLFVLDVAVAVLGLGLVIFIHELGHFLAAKFCDVHVETFSIGFGKAIPGCQFRYGETTYKVGWIPLGGYVKMVGEGDNADTEEAYEDPRSFKNKKVWQRMVIISAGVVMNVILGCICFMVAYSHGVEETPAIVGVVAAGSPAWQQDVRADSQIIQIDTTTRPTFADISPTVMSVEKGKAVPFQIADRAGNVRSVDLFPRRNPEDLYPLVGINPVEQLVLQKGRRGGPAPVRRNSPAFRIVGSDGSKFQGGDRIVATSHDPANPASVKPISVDSRDPSGTKLDAFEFMRNQYRLRGKPMTIQVDRNGTPVTFVLEPAWTQVLPNVRFQMGRLAALRANGPAARAIVIGAAAPALQVAKLDDNDSGDKIIAIEVTPKDGPRRRWVDEPSKDKEPGVEEIPFDPLRLPHDLEVWAETANDLTVRITVLRSATPGAEKTGKRATFEMQWDPKLVMNGEILIGASTPMPISGLGLAYYVENTVDAVTGPSLFVKGDVLTDVRFRDVNDKGEATPDKWLPLKQYQGVYLHALLQRIPSPEIDFKVTRGGEKGVELTVTAMPDETWPAVDRGLILPYDSRLQKADGLIDALGMGLHRTKRTVKVIYQTLYATIFRQISPETMSGPLSIANASYKIAGYDLWQFIIFIGLININLAVVNFLPIPLLDGGHMVFLLYEKIRGKPAPAKLIEWSLYGGLAMILSLMVFVIFLDVRKLFF
jgi:regulator of sigma E protease